MSEVPPILLSAIICEKVIFDKITGGPSLINIIQAINAPQYPVRSGQFVFFCEMTNGHGKTKTKIRLVNADDKTVFEKEGVVEFKDTKQIVTLAMSLQGVVFEGPGEYRFAILAEEHLLGERRMVCKKIELPAKG